MKFRDILGHERVLAALVQAEASGTGHHALLLAGPDGVGKRAIAVGLAALANCVGDAPRDQQGRRVDACGVCKSCRRVLRTGRSDPSRGRGASARGTGGASAEGGHPDVVLLEPDGRQIKIAQVRELLRVVPFPPIEARQRVVIIDPADAMGPEAANALLMTLEEPSSHTRFILLSSRPDALLTTIRSRCQRVTVGRLDDALVERALVDRFEVAPEEARAAAALADGSLGDGLRLLEDPLLRARDALVTRLLHIAPGDVGAAFGLAADLADAKDSRQTVFDMLTRLYRDLLLLRVGVGETLGLAHPNLLPLLQAAAERYGTQALLARIELIEDTRRGVTAVNLNALLAFERLLVALTAAPGYEGDRVRVADALGRR